MNPGKNWLMRFVVLAIALLGAALGSSSPSEAYVQQIVIDQTATVNFSPIILGTSTAGPSTSYTIYQGRIFGTLNTNNPLNTVITDLNLAAPVSSGGNYIANFQIVTPTNPAARSGLLIHEVPNRGGNAISTNAMIQGATYVQSGWQGDLLAQCAPASPAPYPCVDLNAGPYGTLNTTTGAFTAPSVTNISGSATLAGYVVQVPVATLDGTAPNGTNTITGEVYGHVCIGTNGCGLTVGTNTTTAHMAIQSPAFPPYQPASLDTNQAQFWTVTSQTFTGVDSAKTTIPSANWSWSYCPAGGPGTANPTYICLKTGTFNPNLLYEMVYTAANPLVLGNGFAAFRDLASFLRYGTTAPGGGSNPLAGTISSAYTVGASQSGAFIHAFIFYGFNEDEDGRIVFDGAWPQIDGRMMVMNIRWGQPNNLMYLYMGGDEAPVWWADYPNLARNLPADGMLHRCNQTGTCPQILETFASAEMYSEKMSASLCGFTCVADIPLPSNVFRYYVPGATHGGGTVSFNWTSPTSVTIPAGQSLPQDPIPETFINNALQSAFIEWLLSGTPMPPSVYPTLAKGELVLNTQAAEGFPNVPGFTFEGNQAWVPFVYNFGPQENYDQESGIPTIQPPTIQQVLSTYTPKVNADGNENITGLPTVLGQAPLGTYTGWNLATTGWYGPNASNGPGSVGQVFAGAGNSGGYWPFWDTLAHRTANGDPRLSLEERYGTHAGYGCVVTQAANRALEQRYLLASDLTVLISAAAAGNVLTSGYTATTADEGLANDILCGLAATHNFNADVKSDILWRDTSGDVAMWLMNGSTVTSSASLGTIPTTYSIVGQRDFDGDGNADILWRDTSGNLYMWLMNGTTLSSSATLGNVPTTWTVSGTGDFNGDGKGDILWRDSSGNLAVWFMNGSQVAGTANIGNVPITTSIIGTDAHGDIVWRDSSNNVSVWQVSGSQVVQSAMLGMVPSNWVLAGVGDFNGDGYIDLLWRDTSAGTVAIWFLNSTVTVQSTTTLGVVPTTWTIAQTGDYNGDDVSDILWIDNTGNVAQWFISGGQVTSSTALGNVGTIWSAQSQNAE